ncbi:MAG: N-acetyltransferase family protein [Solirubrobacteraceae bacterium]
MDRDQSTSGTAAERAPVAFVTPCTRAELVRLPDGTPLRVEPLRRGDRGTVKRLFARLSPESRLRRFLSPLSALSERDLAFLSDVGRTGHQAVTAVDPRDGSVVGIARYVQHPGRPEAADVAVAVADEVHRRGVGSALMDRLVACAQANGFDRLTATTLWENRAARALLKSTGFQAIASAGAEIELELELDRAPAGPAVA